MPNYPTDVFTGAKNIADPRSSTVDHQPVDVLFPSTALLANDLIPLAPLPVRCVLQDWDINFPAVDTATGITFAIGVMNAGQTDLAVVYGTGLTCGQIAGAIVRATTSASAQDVANIGTVRQLALKVLTPATSYTGSGKRGQVLLGLRG
jgi:hypothetical protein